MAAPRTSGAIWCELSHLAAPDRALRRRFLIPGLWATSTNVSASYYLQAQGIMEPGKAASPARHGDSGGRCRLSWGQAQAPMPAC